MKSHLRLRLLVNLHLTDLLLHNNLLTPVISVFGFLWNSTFGYLLCASGLLRGLAIGSILGLPPSRQTYMKVAVPLVLSAVVTLVTVS